MPNFIVMFTHPIFCPYALSCLYYAHIKPSSLSRKERKPALSAGFFTVVLRFEEESWQASAAQDFEVLCVFSVLLTAENKSQRVKFFSGPSARLVNLNKSHKVSVSAFLFKTGITSTLQG